MASPNRLITLDTETTGLDAQNGDRIIEIGCVAIEGRMMRSTDEHHLQIFVNPEREVPEEAVAIHGITTEYLQDKPKFAEIADKFIDFVKGSTLVIHNAAFDTGFLDMELGRCGRGKISDYCQVIDTVKLAKKLLPGRAVSLDSLCRYYEIDNSNRTLHGALLDAELLAEVYLSLSRGQDTLTLVNEDIDRKTVRPPRLGGAERVGVFATRSPFRPNPIGLTCVKLDHVELTGDGPIVHVLGADLRDGTPIYDIKPYIPFADCHPDATGGWIEDAPWQELDVDFPQALQEMVPSTKLPGLVEVLRQDPRRAGSKHEPNRVYHLAYAGLDISFTVDGTRLTVIAINDARD